MQGTAEQAGLQQSNAALPSRLLRDPPCTALAVSIAADGFSRKSLEF